MHREYPHLTYDVTIKVEHLLQHAEHLNTLRETGCLFVTSAVESIDDQVLAILDKGHTRDDFIRVVRLCREAGLVLNPTFVPFTPWITAEGYQDLLALLAEMDLIDQIAPIQLAIRLLIPAGSKLLELAEVRNIVGPFDKAGLAYPWKHTDPGVDRLQADIQALVQGAAGGGEGRREVFSKVWMLAERHSVGPAPPLAATARCERRAPIPYLTEPWYC
jgi:hypothetical protein